ncbi:MAG TPA: hypothetical protein VJC08_05245, partial [bacterium]|nr:hypothetical protein [bacterium]
AEEVKNSLVQNEDQRGLGRENRELRIVERLAKLELSRDDWNEISSLSLRGSAGAEAISNMKPHLAFYSNAEKRDTAMFQNLMRLMSSSGLTGGSKMDSRLRGNDKNTAILVAGGFHTEGLTRRLKEKGISYLRLMPNIESIPEETNYRAHMRGEVSWKKYLKPEGNKINLYNAFVRGTRDKLLGISPVDADPRLLKSWRDQIILDLANQNKIEKAGDYTKFIDELSDGGKKEKLKAEWMANIDRFLEGLSGLKSRNELNRENVLNLLKLSGAPTPYTSVGGQSVPGATFLVTDASIPILIDARSEVRAQRPAPAQALLYPETAKEIQRLKKMTEALNKQFGQWSPTRGPELFQQGLDELVRYLKTVTKKSDLWDDPANEYLHYFFHGPEAFEAFQLILERLQSQPAQARAEVEKFFKNPSYDFKRIYQINIEFLKGRDSFKELSTFDLISSLLADPENRERLEILSDILLPLSRLKPSGLAKTLQNFRQIQNSITELSRWDFVNRFPGADGIRGARGTRGEIGDESYEAGEVKIPRAIYFSPMPSYAQVFGQTIVLLDAPVETIRHSSWIVLGTGKYGYEPEIRVEGKVRVLKTFQLKDSLDDFLDWQRFKKSQALILGKTPGFEKRDFDKEKISADENKEVDLAIFSKILSREFSGAAGDEKKLGRPIFQALEAFIQSTVTRTRNYEKAAKEIRQAFEQAYQLRAVQLKDFFAGYAARSEARMNEEVDQKKLAGWKNQFAAMYGKENVEIEPGNSAQPNPAEIVIRITLKPGMKTGLEHFRISDAVRQITDKYPQYEMGSNFEQIVKKQSPRGEEIIQIIERLKMKTPGEKKTAEQKTWEDMPQHYAGVPSEIGKKEFEKKHSARLWALYPLYAKGRISFYMDALAGILADSIYDSRTLQVTPEQIRAVDLADPGAMTRKHDREWQEIGEEKWSDEKKRKNRGRIAFELKQNQLILFLKELLPGDENTHVELVLLRALQKKTALTMAGARSEVRADEKQAKLSRSEQRNEKTVQGGLSEQRVSMLAGLLAPGEVRSELRFKETDPAIITEDLLKVEVPLGGMAKALKEEVERLLPIILENRKAVEAAGKVSAVTPEQVRAWITHWMGKLAALSDKKYSLVVYLKKNAGPTQIKNTAEALSRFQDQIEGVFIVSDDRSSTQDITHLLKGNELFVSALKNLDLIKSTLFVNQPGVPVIMNDDVKVQKVDDNPLALGIGLAGTDENQDDPLLGLAASVLEVASSLSVLNELDRNHLRAEDLKRSKESAEAVKAALIWELLDGYTAGSVFTFKEGHLSINPGALGKMMAEYRAAAKAKVSA